METLKASGEKRSIRFWLEQLARCPWVRFVSLLTVGLLVPGLLSGRGSVAAFLCFWLLNTALLVAASRLVALFFRDSRPTDSLIRTLLMAFAIVVLLEGFLGVIGFLNSISCAVILGLLLAVVFRIQASQPAADRVELPRLPFIVYPVAALLLLAFCMGIASAPLEYDALTYHLFFPARWLQEARMIMIPTPFADQSPAYAPLNGEMFFLWLMLPFHGDFLAGAGQFPFLLFSAFVLYGIARKLGASARVALLPACFFCLSKPALEQAMSANVDLIFTGTFLSTAYLWMNAAESKKHADFALFGVSLGLWLGTKFIAPVHLPILILFGWAIGGFNRRIVWAIPGVLIFGASWYLRNWMLTGSPVYPASLEIAGVTLAQGAYSPKAMLNSPFHIPTAELLPAVVALAFGPKLFLVWVPVAVGAICALVKNSRWRPHAVVALMPVLLLLLHWYFIPYNSQIRFLFPATALAMLCFAFVPEFFPRCRIWFPWVCVAASLWLILGLNPVFSIFGVPVIREGLLNLNYAAIFAALTVLIFAWFHFAPRTQHFVLITAVGLACIFNGLFAYCAAGSRERRAFVHQPPPFIRQQVKDAWDWVEKNISGSSIAYTGCNIPYRLMGRHLENRVNYVNIRGDARWLFHDFDRLERARSGYQPPATAKPGYDRLEPDREAWLGHLENQGTEYLFVSILAEDESRYIAHDSDGFPVERNWADVDSKRFALVFDDRLTRIYKVQPVR